MEIELGFECREWVENGEIGSCVTGMTDCVGIVSALDLILI